MSFSTMAIPLQDVTLLRLSNANKVLPQGKLTDKAPVVPVKLPARIRRNNPYGGWEWRAQGAPLNTTDTIVSEPTVTLLDTAVVPRVETVEMEASALCHVLVQFKCHHGEFSAHFALKKGQYVVVQGDRGMDVGVVIRINSDDNQQYVERTGPAGPVLRHATQREVNYWATDLKNDESAALEYCRQRVIRHRLQMDVRHAEYQFDKKKLTFYYEAKSRVDFVVLLKELFREFSCRIWMEKVRTHE
jgi:hypothetical protein